MTAGSGARDGADADTDGGYADADAADRTDEGGLRTLVSGTRFGQFVSVGVVGSVFDVSASTLLRELGVLPELAVIAGIETAVVVMFLLNDRITFADQGAGGVRAAVRRLVRSNVVRLGGIAVQLLAFTALYRGIALRASVAGVDGWFVVSKVAGIGAGMLVNYVAESLFTWRVAD